MRPIADIFPSSMPPSAVAAALGGSKPNPFAAFNATGSQIASSWIFENPDSISGLSVTDVSGDAWMRCNVGGASGSFWFDRNRGILLRPPATVTGPFDWRTEFTVRNDANSGDPTLGSGFRIGGPAVHDPTNFEVATSQFNYVHFGGGSTGTGLRRVEWKSNDDNGTSGDASAFFAQTPTLTNFRLQVRFIRRASDPDVFDIQYREPATDEDLWSESTAWVDSFSAFNPIDRSDGTSPDRSTFGAGAGDIAVVLPDELYAGFAIYSNTATTDLSLLIHRSGMRATSA